MDSTSTTETWLQTNFGNAFDFLDPKPEQINIEDIALALARIPRFGAKTMETEYTYSVAQHSVLVSHLVPDEIALAGLLHDAAEGLLGFDVPTPVKDALPEFKTRIEEPIDRAVFARFGIPWEYMAQVKKADLDALMIERYWLLEEEPRPWLVDHLPQYQIAKPEWEEWVNEWGGDIIPPLPWQETRALFLRRFHEVNGTRWAMPRVAGTAGWTWDERKADFWRHGRLGEGVEWMGFRQAFPHVQIVEIGV